MKNVFLFAFIGTILSTTLPSCVSPSIIRMESARMLQKNQVQASVSYSSYAFYNYELERQENFSTAVSYGISSKVNAKFRYCYMNTPNNWEEFIGSQNLNLHLLELGGKFEIERKYVAAEVAIQNYMKRGKSKGILHLMAHVTVPYKKYFELTATSGISSYVDSKLATIPFVALGIGVSSDLDRWALRLEANSFFEYGLGLSYSFGLGKGITL